MIENGTVLPIPLLDVNVSNKFERGMLGIALSRSESNVTNVFLYFTQANDSDGKDSCADSTHCSQTNEPVGNRVYKYELAENKSKLLNPRLLLDLPARPGAEHNGGVILIRPDRNILMPVGAVASSYLWSTLLVLSYISYFFFRKIEFCVKFMTIISVLPLFDILLIRVTRK